MTEEHKQQQNKIDYQDVLNNFVPCGRCSFFLAGYRVLYGLEVVEEAAAQSDGEWLELASSWETRHLLQKSYGSKLDISLTYYDSLCPECRRRFIYRAEEEGESLQLELK